ncbi:hypothetical protein HMI54_012522 [Coelomomyces lativittatus]|nr:hypothetical protein HMI54_012522 [Coelomomyces lativittatus]
MPTNVPPFSSPLMPFLPSPFSSSSSSTHASWFQPPSFFPNLPPSSSSSSSSWNTHSLNENLNDPDLMRNLMRSPMMQMLTDHPDILRGFMMMDPRLRQLSESNPEIGQLLSDPSFMRQLTSLLKKDIFVSSCFFLIQKKN